MLKARGKREKSADMEAVILHGGTNKNSGFRVMRTGVRNEKLLRRSELSILPVKMPCKNVRSSAPRRFASFSTLYDAHKPSYSDMLKRSRRVPAKKAKKLMLNSFQSI